MNLEFINQTDTKFDKKIINKMIDDIFSHEKIINIYELQTSLNSITVIFVTLDESKRLNNTFRKKNYPTDVLSFAAVEDDSLGELAICYDLITSQAKEHEVTFLMEMVYMLLHGVLHLFGFDHEEKEEGEVMLKLQDHIFDDLIKDSFYQ